MHKDVFLLAGVLACSGCGQAEDPADVRSAGAREAEEEREPRPQGKSDDDQGDAAEETRTEPDPGSSPAVPADIDAPTIDAIDPADSEDVGSVDPAPSTEMDPVDDAPEPSPSDADEPTNGPPARSSDGPSFTTTVGPLFNGKCTQSCHEPGGVLGGPGGFDPNVQMSLALADAYQTLTTQRSVQLPTMWLVGETPEESYVWRKLTDTHLDAGGSGAAMPITGVVTDEELAIVRAWIEGGASP